MLPLLTGALLAACFARDPSRLCQDASACEKGSACIVGRCRSSADPVFVSTSRRVVLAPIDIAVLSSKNGEPLEGGEVALGRATLGDVALLLRFDAAVGEGVDVTSAFLTVHPGDHPAAPAGPIAYTVASIGAPWQSSAVTWARQPPLGVPETVAAPTARGPSVLRIDVTHLFRVSAGLANGVAVLVTGDDPIGASYATGLGAGAPPELELTLVERNPASAVPSAIASASASASAAVGPAASASAEPSAAPPRRPRPSDKKPSRPRH